MVDFISFLFLPFFFFLNESAEGTLNGDRRR